MGALVYAPKPEKSNMVTLMGIRFVILLGLYLATLSVFTTLIFTIMQLLHPLGAGALDPAIES